MIYIFILCIILAIIVTCSIVIPKIRKRSKSVERNYIEQFFQRKHASTLNKRDLFNSYYHGINDIYDSNGNKYEGIEPQPQLALQTLQSLIEEENRPKDRLLLAQIHSQGFHNYEPNEQAARNTITDILNNVPDLNVRLEAEELLRELPRTLPPDITQDLRGHPVGGDDTMDNIANDELFALDIQRAIHNSLRDPNFETPRHNDSQNVHDSGIMGTIKRSVKAISNDVPSNSSSNEFYNDIEKEIKERLTGVKQTDALRSLEDIRGKKNSNRLHTGKTVGETIGMVWNRIHAPVNQKNKDSLKGNLVNNLAEMQEHGKIVCSTGIGNKLVDSLNKVDPEVNIKPMYSLNQEIMFKGAKIQDDFIKSLSENDQGLYNTNTHPSQERLDSELKSTIIDTLKKDYVENGVLTSKKLMSEINKWIDHV